MKKIILSLISFCMVTGCFGQVADSLQRHVVLQGAANFRDLGGYKTKSGQYVKWNKIYRSADISKLTDADLSELKKRTITHDVDLRGTQEAKQAPDRLNPNTDYIICPAGSDDVNNAMMKSLAKAKGAQGDSIIKAYYANTTFLADRYKPFFDKLLTLPADESLVFHCTAGKDRTGIAAALFLYSLGVPYNTIVSDYEASNYYRAADNKKMAASMVTLMHIDEGVAKDVLGVKKSYLDTTFDALKKQYGSIDNYLKNQIGLDAVKIKELKLRYLSNQPN